MRGEEGREGICFGMNYNHLSTRWRRPRSNFHYVPIVAASALAVVAVFVGYGIVQTQNFQQNVTSQKTTPVTTSSRTAESKAVGRMQVVVGLVLAGQSNMAGRGGVLRTEGGKQWDNYVPEECSTRADFKERVLSLHTSGNWEAASEPLHDGIDARGKVVGVGPGLALANQLATASEETAFGLIPCAQGESFISQWLPKMELFEKMIRRAQTAINSGAQLEYLIWYQGENDATREDTAGRYETNLRQFIHAVRAELCDRLKIIVIGISVSPTRQDIPFAPAVRRAQKEVSMTTPNVEYVDTIGLELAADGVHLTTAAQVMLGQRLAKVIQSKENYK